MFSFVELCTERWFLDASFQVSLFLFRDTVMFSANYPLLGGLDASTLTAWVTFRRSMGPDFELYSCLVLWCAATVPRNRKSHASRIDFFVVSDFLDAVFLTFAASETGSKICGVSWSAQDPTLAVE